MNFNYSQIFLLIWMIIFWIFYFLTYGKVEMKHEKSVKEKYGWSRWKYLDGITFFLWVVFVLIYVFYYDGIEWIYKISFLDNDFFKILGMIIMCFSYLPLIMFTKSVGKSIEIGINKGGKPELIITGIYSYIRHPSYLGIDLAVFGTFLLIPNILALALLLFVIAALYGLTIGEEKILLEMYREKYEKYKKNVGGFFPKIKKRK